MYDTEFGRLRVKDIFYLKEDYLLSENPTVYVKISDDEAVKIMIMPVIKAINKDTKVIPESHVGLL